MENVTIKAPALIFLGPLWICIQREVDITRWRFLLMIASQEALLIPKSERSATIILLLQIIYAGKNHLGSLQLQLSFTMGSAQTHGQTELADTWVSCVLLQGRMCAKSQFSALSLGYFYLLFNALKTWAAADRAKEFVSSSSSIKCNCLC